ncbi:MAG: NifU family protein [Tepidisphaeraceae bacterium]
MPTGPASNAPGTSLDERVRAALERIRPAVKADGGDVELVDVAGDTVRVRFKGACVGCPSSSLTLRMGIERTVRDAAPEIKSVVAIS